MQAKQQQAAKLVTPDEKVVGTMTGFWMLTVALWSRENNHYGEASFGVGDMAGAMVQNYVAMTGWNN